MKHLARGGVWRTHLQILLWRHGWVWPALALLVLATAAMNWTVLQPARSALLATQGELAREQAAAPDKAMAREPLPEKQHLDGLQAMLRRSPEPAQLLQQMATIAQAQQINLPQGEYQQQLHPATRVIQVQVSQPVRASYPQLRSYIESVLRTIPNASLDHVTARRENVGQSQLEVRLRWSFWILPGPVAAPDEARAAK